jgi:hypothetical protein
MSDVAERGIRVTLLSSLANETVVAIPTRYGDVTVTRDGAVCCTGHIRYGDQRVEIASTGQIYASLEGVYKVKEGDLVVISSASGARGSPPRHHVLLVDQDGMTDLTDASFGTSDGTFKATQRDDEVHFDLGFKKERRKLRSTKIGSQWKFARRGRRRLCQRTNARLPASTEGGARRIHEKTSYLHPERCRRGAVRGLSIGTDESGRQGVWVTNGTAGGAQTSLILCDIRSSGLQ